MMGGMEVTELVEVRRGYSDFELADIIGAPIEQVRQWIEGGLLITPEAGFTFQHLTRAQTLKDLSASGLSLKKLRAELKKLDRSAPTSPAVVANDGQILARLEGGELIRSDGQLQLDFDDDDAEPVAIVTPRNPRSAADWYSCGIAHEAQGDLRAAINCYRESLLAGGPDIEVCFALAHALAATADHAQAAERYRQVIEIDPKQPDAWNNLGVALCELNRLDEACDAFTRALKLRPTDPGPRYNLADALDELGHTVKAKEHWRQYLQVDRQSPRAAYARRRLAAS
jgi:tetratricopeptide (TPR) repeat protein